MSDVSVPEPERLDPPLPPLKEPPGPQPKSRWSELGPRVASAAVLAPVVIGLSWLGGVWFWALLLVVAVLAWWEWLGLVAPEDRLLPDLGRCWPLFFGGGSLLFALVIGSTHGMGPALAVLLVCAAAFYALCVNQERPRPLIETAGLAYVGLPSLALLWLREAPEQGLAWLCMVLCFVWATDIGAYFGGRLIGGPKIAPRISPSKTWAGLISGAAAAGLFGFVLANYLGAAQPAWALLLGPVLAVVAQAGDFVESWLKREAGLKDSSHLIPGHGGILDRIDGLIPAAILFALIQSVAGGWW